MTINSRTLRTLQFTTLALAVILSSPISFAQQYGGGQYGGGQNQYSGGNFRRAAFERVKHQEKKIFLLGVCVGQTLATASPPVTLPMPVPGQSPAPIDQTTLTALQSAIQTCKAQMQPTGPSPSPSPTQPTQPTNPGNGPLPSPSPTATPTTVTTTTPAASTITGSTTFN